MRYLFLFFFFSCTSPLSNKTTEANSNHTVLPLKDATIIALHQEECGCCWGWEIKIGNRTIMTDKLPVDKPYDLFTWGDKPLKVKIALGQQEKVCKQYYEVLVIQKK